MNVFRWIKCCVYKITSCFNEVVKFTFKTITAAFVGYIFIALFLNFMNACSPNNYKRLTYWANQKKTPSLTNCTFTKLLKPEFPAYKYYDWYDVEVILSQGDFLGTIIIYPDDENIALVNKVEFPTLKKNPKPYKVFWKQKFDNKLPKFKILIDNRYYDFIVNKTYDYYQCPIKVEFFIDE